AAATAFGDEPCLEPDFAEPSVADILEEQNSLAVLRIERVRVDLRVDVAVDGVDVEVAIVVIVEEGRAPAEVVPGRLVVAGATRQISKDVLAEVAVERVGLIREVRDVKVEAAVPVVITEVDPHARLLATVFVDADAGGESDLGEPATAVVAVQVAR